MTPSYVTSAAQPAEWHDKQAALLEGFLAAPAFPAPAYARASIAYHREQAALRRADAEPDAALGVRWDPGL